MRAIAIAFSAAMLAAGAAYAHGSLTEAPDPQSAGTLTCITKPDVSLIFGRTPIADCTFVSERGNFRQSYVAMFSRATHVDTAQKVSWRVLTKDGFARPGMLSDLFTVPVSQSESAKAPTAPEMMGRAATLQLLSHSGQTSAKFALSQPRIALAATEPDLIR